MCHIKLINGQSHINIWNRWMDVCIDWTRAVTCLTSWTIWIKHDATWRKTGDNSFLALLFIVTMKSYDEGYLFLLSYVYIHEFKVDIQSAISPFSFSPLFLRVEHELSSPPLSLSSCVLLFYSPSLHLLFFSLPVRSHFSHYSKRRRWTKGVVVVSASDEQLNIHIYICKEEDATTPASLHWQTTISTDGQQS